MRLASPKYREYNREYQRKWRAKNPEKHRGYSREYYRRLRTETLRLLGNKCIVCGESDWRCLQVDHVNGGGCSSRRENCSTSFYVKILQEIKNGSKDYQCLCANCNWKKRYTNNEVLAGDYDEEVT